ncbi:dihydrouridine synthase [Dictyocaulus viviparus]|uniref:Dihydrouridine synthase n=1 Tax=Dictyocaulus viviparus TaxID=29172 RepID=A0A0D8XCI7_DICVI|nr:dihydrouridine synthase [Dictyocaulus viviparus]
MASNSNHTEDRPLIVQFASDDPFIFASAAELVYRYSSGVDLNCGCPKSDVRAKGFGSILLNRPDHLAEIVKQCRARISDPEFTISLKIRIHYPLNKIVDLCQKAEKAGVSHLTVHGRTPQMRGEPVDYNAIRIIKESLRIPVIANGDITQLTQALNIAERTGANGIMAANGLLYNPAMFAGFEYTPIECIKDFLRLSADHGLPLHLFQQHLIYMLYNLVTPTQRRVLHQLSSRPAIENFLSDVLMINDVEYL